MIEKNALSPLRPAQASPESVEVSGRETLFRGYGTLYELTYRHRRFDRSWSPVLSRELYDPGDSVIVLPVDPDRAEVLLIEQLRPAPLLRGDPPVMLECVAGRGEKGETPEASAIRECREEAGQDLTRAQIILQCYPTPGAVAERFTFVLGRTETAHAGGLHGADHEQEDIRAFAAPLDTLPEALAAGAFANAPTVIAMQWLTLNRDRLPELLA